jgi:hypothetical protein
MTAPATPPIPVDDVEEFNISDLIGFDPASDPNALLGKRWLGRGMMGMWFAPTGVGKSSLATDAAVTWSRGESWFGITPTHPLKILIIQAENDLGDVAEMLLGVCRQRAVSPADLQDRIVIVRANGVTGPGFWGFLERQIKKHDPSLVFVDPLLNYAGDDLSLQRPAAEFLDGVQSVVSKYRIACILIHHSGKPPKMKGDREALDHGSAYFGSMALSAKPRSVMGLRRLDDGGFVLREFKRGKRVGLLDLEGNEVDHIYLEHSSTGIGWEQVPGPAEGEEGGGAGRKDRLEEYVDNRILYAPKSRELEAPSRDKIMEKMGLSKRRVQMYEARFKDLSKKVKKFPFN